MNSLKFYIDKLKDCDAHEVINSLRVNPVLSVEEKNLIYLYLFPRPLLDRQLPERIIAYKEGGQLTEKIRTHKDLFNQISEKLDYLWRLIVRNSIKDL